MKANRVEALEVYQLAFSLQQRLFDLSKAFPREEAYSLTDQMRRSSRSVGANLSEAWAKRHYLAHFRAKLTDADGEKEETLHWIASAHACGYLDSPTTQTLVADYMIVGRQLGTMIRDAESWCQPFASATPPTSSNRPPATGNCPPEAGDRTPATGHR